jgi:hypothetical protein
MEIFLVDHAPGTCLSQALDRWHRRIAGPHRNVLAFDRLTEHGARIVSGHLNRLTLAIVFSLSLALDARAETVAETALKWGLIGPWSLDCSLAPDRHQGTVLSYDVARGGRVVHRRDFGDTADEGRVLGAEISADGMLNLRVHFPRLKETREYGLMMQPDGTMRAIYNRNQKHEYTIRDGKFVADGHPTPPQHKCGSQTSELLLRPLS